MRPASSGGRWKKIVVGLLIAGIVTFVMAYYLPLHRAHETLNAQHRLLTDKAQLVEQKLNQVVTELKTTTQRRDELEGERQTRESAQKSQTERLTGAKGELSEKLDKYVKKGMAAVSQTNGRVVVALSESLIFLPLKADVSPQGKAILCEVAKASGSALSLENNVFVAGANGAAPTLPAGFTSVWAFSAARAASVGQTLEEKCRVPGARLRAAGHGPQKAAESGIAKQMPSRLEIEVFPETQSAG